MNILSSAYDKKRLFAAQSLILLNCYFCFTYIYESGLMHASWLIVPAACILWLTTKPWKQFVFSTLTVIQIILFMWFIVITAVHGEFGLGPQMLLSGVFLFFIMSNVFESGEEATQATLRLLFTIATLSTLYCILGFIRALLVPMSMPYRGEGIAAHPNHFGAFCFIGLTAIVGVYHFWGKKAAWGVKLTLACMFLLNLCSLFFSDSRAAFVGIITFCLCYFLILSYRVIHSKKLYWILFFALIFLACTMSVWYVFHRGYNFSDSESLYSILDKLSSGRMKLWRTGLQIIGAHPIFGITSPEYDALIYENCGEYLGQHNIIMGLGTQFGIPAIILLFALVIGTGVVIVRTYKKSSVDNKQKEYLLFWACFLLALLMNDMFETYIFFLHMPNSFLFLFGIGVVARINQDTKQKEKT